MKQEVKNKMMVIPNRRLKLSAICLFLGSFFLPFGYDAAFAAIMKLTGSYWITDIFFYFVSACFFGLYFWLSKVNPFLKIRDIFLNVWFNKIKHYGKKKSNF
jgi:hypothetical protein